jgi:Spy/CpxP family protein refolding chaperone
MPFRRLPAPDIDGTGAREAENRVKSLIVFGSIVAVLLASFPAMAQHAQGGRGAVRGAPGRPTPPQQIPARDTTQNRDARMTPEQRQQLRRDVHDHGREIYRDRSGPARP